MPLQNASNDNFEKAVGFINISIIQADGTEIRLQKGIPLKGSNRMEAAINEALKSNPDKPLNVKATYQEVTDTPVTVNLFGEAEATEEASA